MYELPPMTPDAVADVVVAARDLPEHLRQGLVEAMTRSRDHWVIEGEHRLARFWNTVAALVAWAGDLETTAERSIDAAFGGWPQDDPPES